MGGPARWDDGLGRMLARIDDTARRDLDGFPTYADPGTGEWVTSPDGDWTGGFWAGELWLAYRATGARRYAELAASSCQALRPRVGSATVWRSFLFYYGAALGEILHRDQAASAVALEGARGLAAMFDQRASVLPLGPEAAEGGEARTVIDAVGPVSALLGWASATTGDPSYRDLAARHARRHIELCVREDGSVSQTASFDRGTGAVTRRYSHQGYSEESTWARAQAWAMLGFALSATRVPEDEAFLRAAVRVADWWLEHVPADRVAFWDFSDPAIPATERDTSATAIAAASLLKLGQLAADGDRRSRYRDAGEATVRALVDGYLTPTGPGDRRRPGMLTDGCYHRHLGLAPRHELIWGDYYLLEALLVLGGRVPALDL